MGAQPHYSNSTRLGGGSAENAIFDMIAGNAQCEMRIRQSRVHKMHSSMMPGLLVACASLDVVTFNRLIRAMERHLMPVSNVPFGGPATARRSNAVSDVPFGGPAAKPRRSPRRKAASPKRRKAASPKRRKAASPKRRKAASPKRRRKASPKRRRKASPKRRRKASPKRK